MCGYYDKPAREPTSATYSDDLSRALTERRLEPNLAKVAHVAVPERAKVPSPIHLTRLGPGVRRRVPDVFYVPNPRTGTVLQFSMYCETE